MARRVEEGDRRAVGRRHLIGADVLGDAAGLARDHVRLADLVEQRGLAVIDVTHDRHHRRPRRQLALVLGRLLHDHVLDVRLGDALHAMAELLDDERRGLGVDRLVLRRHDPVLEQRLDHRGRALGHAVGELLHRDRVGDAHVAHHLLALAGMARHLALLALLAALQRGEAALAAALVGRVRDGQLARAAAVVVALQAAALLVGGRLGGGLLGDRGRASGLGAGGHGLRGGRVLDHRLALVGAGPRLRGGGAGGLGGALLGLGGLALGADLGLALGALGGLLLGAQPGHLRLALGGGGLLGAGALGLLGARGADRLQPPLDLALRQALQRRLRLARAGDPGAGLRRHRHALALALHRHRLGPAVAEALAHVARLRAAAQAERLALAVPVLGINHSQPAFPRGGRPPPCPARAYRGPHPF
jgi:hypothetical protein